VTRNSKKYITSGVTEISGANRKSTIPAKPSAISTGKLVPTIGPVIESECRSICMIAPVLFPGEMSATFSWRNPTDDRDGVNDCP